jgi:hypothetical protein
MLADIVATPVLERLAAGPCDGALRSASPALAYVDLSGFVVALTAPRVPLMSNGVAVARTALAGGAVRAAPGAIVIGAVRVAWDPVDPPRWEPALRRATPAERGALAARGAALLDGVGATAGPWADGALATAPGARGREGARHLRRALPDRDPDDAARAADRLIGLGAGLTPEGDDVLTAVAAVVVAAGDAVGLTGARRSRLIAALAPADRGERTTALSATLLGLAAEGRIAEPVHPLLDPGGRRWREALARLEGTGASTGRAYATAVGATLSLLTAERSV